MDNVEMQQMLSQILIEVKELKTKFSKLERKIEEKFDKVEKEHQKMDADIDKIYYHVEHRFDILESQ